MYNWAVRVQPDLTDVQLKLVVQLVKSQTSLMDGGRTAGIPLIIRTGGVVTGAGVRCSGGGLSKS